MQHSGGQSGKKLNIGILAHVDAGKTTLSEAILYISGALRRAGRVDHGDCFLDHYGQERSRGITIFSKQADFLYHGTDFTLIDTPGHVDFSCEMERTLQVLDCAVLVINGADGVQSHTRTLWSLLEQYQIPVFFFVNKMDQVGADLIRCFSELQTLSKNVIDFSSEEWHELAAQESEEALDSFLENGSVSDEIIRRLILQRQIFPCFCGAALKLDGVDKLMNALAQFAPIPSYPAEFGARVYKISRDEQGARLTWMKITGGELSVKELVSGTAEKGEAWQEKANQIRIYSGGKFHLTEKVPAGTVCAVAGLSKTFAGEGIGIEEKTTVFSQTPVLAYHVRADKTDPHDLLEKLRILEEETPELQVSWNSVLREVSVNLMGDIQMDILRNQMEERFSIHIEFGEGGILYKETICDSVEGVGHFEPLRHYAEVHLRLDPGPRGSGISVFTECPTDVLSLNWQRLIMAHIQEKQHLGVLIGAPITDIAVTIINGRAHEKHTEGGDFRQATYRAVRQGLMKAESILLEPWYSFRMILPASISGRAITDIQNMGGEMDPVSVEGTDAVVTGCAPVSEMRHYGRELLAYSRGSGRLSCSFCGYRPCIKQAQIIADAAYDAERDLENTADSVFCSHGAGFTVKWDKVHEYMHLESGIRSVAVDVSAPLEERKNTGGSTSGTKLDKELQAIFEKTYGPIKQKTQGKRTNSAPGESPRSMKAVPVPTGPEYLLVDGYNIIYAWEGLSRVAEDNLDAARQLLMDMLCNYQSIRQCRVILVFDAYRVSAHREEIVQYGNIHVVYTKEAETADAYIEKTSREIAKNHRVRVATSDNLEQLIILKQGALRMSAKAFEEEVEAASAELHTLIQRINTHEVHRGIEAAFRSARENAERK